MVKLFVNKLIDYFQMPDSAFCNIKEQNVNQNYINPNYKREN